MIADLKPYAEYKESEENKEVGNLFSPPAITDDL